MGLLGTAAASAARPVLDVGGGLGTYAAPLAGRGYRVHVLDPPPLHVEQARQARRSGLLAHREPRQPRSGRQTRVFITAYFHLLWSQHSVGGMTVRAPGGENVVAMFFAPVPATAAWQHRGARSGFEVVSLAARGDRCGIGRWTTAIEGEAARRGLRAGARSAG
jgi:hypothetical protein